MKKIYTSKRPANSLIRECMYQDFSDCFAMTLERPDIYVDDVVHCFFTTSPAIVVRLMQLRDFMVRCMGLKRGSYAKKDVVLKPGEERGLFKMYKYNDHEAIIGADDRHLNFRTSLYVRQVGATTEIMISTVVVFNNNLGKYYMKLITPFHKMVVRTIMKHMHESLMALPPRNREQAPLGDYA